MWFEIRSVGRKALTVSVFALMACNGYTAQAQQQPQSSSGASSAGATARWEMDAVTHKSMEGIHLAMATRADAIQGEKLSAQEYQQLAQTIEQDLAAMVKSRLLSKELEKAFHLVVMIDLDHSLQLMRTSTTPQLQRAGAFGVLQALRNYRTYFQYQGV